MQAQAVGSGLVSKHLSRFTVRHVYHRRNLKGSFHVTHGMTSERCLPACADTQTGLPAAIKALWSMDRDSTGQARPWLLGDPPPVLSRSEGPYRRACPE